MNNEKNETANFAFSLIWVYLGSASSRRRRWCVWVLQELPEMPQPPENEAGLTAPRPEVFLRDLNLGI